MFPFRKNYHSESDEALLTFIAKGQERAFNVLYERYASRMHYYFYRMLYQDTEKANDFTQDFFVKVIEHAKRFDANRKCSTWMYSIANNMCKNEYRRVERYNKNNAMYTRDFVETIEMPCGESRFLPERIDRELFSQHLDQAINELELIHRECFVLRYREELSIREISQILNCPEGTIKSRLYYSLKKLSVKLKIFHPDHLKYTEYGKKTR